MTKIEDETIFLGPGPEHEYVLPPGLKSRNVSDGYHTFDELYQFRCAYNAMFFNELANKPHNPLNVHKSLKHNDGEECFGGDYFIVAANLPTGVITNHYEMRFSQYFKIPEKEECLFPYDGHTSKDVLSRIFLYLTYYA